MPVQITLDLIMKGSILAPLKKGAMMNFNDIPTAWQSIGEIKHNNSVAQIYYAWIREPIQT